jgi:hypothetical protein
MLTSTGTVTLNKWHHIAVTGNTSGLRIYINGVLNASNAVAYGGNITPNNLTIGADIVQAEYFKGIIDDARVFNRSLSAAEISALYNNRSDLLVTQELALGDNWTTCVTPNDAIEEGSTVCSNGVLERLISCSYSGGNWLVQCVDNCAFSTNVDMLGNNITFSGSGTVNITANITNFTQAVVQSGCNVAIYNNSNLKGGR